VDENVIHRNFRQSKCDSNEDLFRQLRSRTKLRNDYIKIKEVVGSLYECEKLCLRENQFECKSFNFIDKFTPALDTNCELSDRDAQDLDLTNPNQFENSEDHDFYARETGSLRTLEPCIDVTQSCNQDGMVFTLRTPTGTIFALAW
jgi:hypothetical protein